jgi:hypothetical protein
MMPEISSASSNKPMTHLEGTNEYDLGKKNVLKLRLKLTSILSIQDQGSFIRRDQTKENGNESDKIERNLTILQNSSDNTQKLDGPDFKFFDSSKNSGFSKNVNNNSVSDRTNDTVSDTNKSEFAKNNISSRRETEMKKLQVEGRYQEREIAKTIPRIQSKEQVSMSDEDLIPAENLNSGFYLIYTFLPTVP